MDYLKTFLPSKLYEVIERAGICTAKQILIMSPWDIKKVTNLNLEDICLIKNVVSDYYCPVITTCDELLLQKLPLRVSTGCLAIDSIIKGGLRRGTITELYGESGTGKTQFALQLALQNWESGTVYICTEDLFPVKRYDQMKKLLPAYNNVTDYGKNIFVEHINESNELLSCVRMQLPKLLSTNPISLIVIDSIAAPFRTENTNYIQRAEELREMAMYLLKAAQQYKLAVLCINQVTASMDDVDDKVLPTLGLAWSNMISTRLWIRKVNKYVKIPEGNLTAVNQELPSPSTVQARQLIIVFAPDLPKKTAEFIITSKGIENAEVNCTF